MEKPIERIRREIEMYQETSRYLEGLISQVKNAKQCEESIRMLLGLNKAHTAAQQLLSSLHASRMTLQRQCLHKKKVEGPDSEYCKECGRVLKIFKH